MDKPKVTIAIPAYNQAKYIKQTIDSALNQDYPNLEVVVSDDASLDDTRQIVKEYNDKRLKYYRNEKNIGRVANHRKLLYEYATGEYVLNLDGDDYLIATDAISFMVNQINFYHKQECANIVMVMALAETVFDDSKITYKRKEETCINGFYVFLNWNKIPYFHSATLYLRQAAVKIGFYKHDIINEDVESFLRLCLLGNVILSNKVIATWRLHENNVSMLSDIDKLFDSLEFIKSPYRYALGLGFDKKQLLKWKNTMLLDRYNKMLSKILLAKNKSAFITFVKRLHKEDKKGFRIIFYPKNIIKIISFYVPFLFDLLRHLKWFFTNKSKPPRL
ncbi:glycosyltransferase family 2 protein [Desulfurella sp.]|uniref:glycosyltransferase family 2 protein n=1 Tax=Desulfurella sp. TaxID=1962857 RepID=UPI0025BDC562|nr:glycosyltransferase family 2 protein [Desulfurella sp.]